MEDQELTLIQLMYNSNSIALGNSLINYKVGDKIIKKERTYWESSNKDEYEKEVAKTTFKDKFNNGRTYTKANKQWKTKKYTK